MKQENDLNFPHPFEALTTNFSPTVITLPEVKFRPQSKIAAPPDVKGFFRLCVHTRDEVR